MKHPTLFDIPKDSPSKQYKIDAFKLRHRIWTNRVDHMPEAPWVALLLEPGEKRHPMEVIADECRLLDESGRLVDGMGEVSVIRRICENCGIPFDL